MTEVRPGDPYLPPTVRVDVSFLVAELLDPDPDEALPSVHPRPRSLPSSASQGGAVVDTLDDEELRQAPG